MDRVRVGAGNGTKEYGNVPRRAGERAGVVERPRQRHHAEPRHPSIAGFSPAMPQNEAGMRIEPPVSLPYEPKSIPAATAAAEPPLEPLVGAAEIPRIPGRTVVRVDAGVREFEHVGFGDDDGASRAQDA